MANGGRNGERDHWLDRRETADKIHRGLWLVCALLLFADLLYDKHAKFAVEAVFGFYGWYALVFCLLLILAAKQLRKLLMRPEDYYDR